MERRVLELEAEDASRNASRPVLRGTPVPGDAWEDYERAMASLEHFPDTELLAGFAERTGKATEQRVAEIVSAQEEALRTFRQGTRRGTARHAGIHPRVAHEFSEDAFGNGALHALTVLALSQARLLDNGRHLLESVELLLDLAQLESDVGRIPTPFAETLGNLYFQKTVVELGRRVLWAGAPLLEQIERELAILDASFPEHGPALRGQVEHVGRLMLEDKYLQHLLGDTPRPPRMTILSWREGYSWELVEAAAFDQADAWLPRLEQIDRSDWKDAKRLWEEVYKDSSDSHNVLITGFPWGADLPGVLRRKNLARIRFLRIAAHFRRTGEILELADPFGDRIGVETSGTHLRCWSKSEDGKYIPSQNSWIQNGSSLIFEVER